MIILPSCNDTPHPLRAIHPPYSNTNHQSPGTLYYKTAMDLACSGESFRAPSSLISWTYVCSTKEDWTLVKQGTLCIYLRRYSLPGPSALQPTTIEMQADLRQNKNLRESEDHSSRRWNLQLYQESLREGFYIHEERFFDRDTASNKQCAVRVECIINSRGVIIDGT